MAKLNVFKKQNIVCMSLMKTVLLVTTLNMILFEPISGHEACPNELKETDVQLDDFRPKEIALIEARADEVCKGTSRKDDDECTKSCPKPQSGKCKLYPKKETNAVKTAIREITGHCKAVCMCESHSLKHAWAVWLKEENPAKEVRDWARDFNCNSLVNEEVKCQGLCPEGCKPKCKSSKFGITCFCDPPKNGLFDGHMSMPGTSANHIKDFCKKGK